MRLPTSVRSGRRILSLAAISVSLGLALTACGADPESPVTGAEPSMTPGASDDSMDDANQGGDQGGNTEGDLEKDNQGETEVDTSNSVLPPVQVKDVAGGEVDLAGLVPSEKPILLWAWAPHCPICAGEAPAVEEFSQKNANAVTVVGLGTQDDLALAEDFVSTYGVSTPQMLWDPGFESWQALQITGQPTWVLLSPGGEEIGRWQGSLPEDEILAKV